MKGQKKSERIWIEYFISLKECAAVSKLIAELLKEYGVEK